MSAGSQIEMLVALVLDKQGLIALDLHKWRLANLGTETRSLML